MALVWRGKWQETALLLLCVLGPTFAALQLPECPSGEYRPEDWNGVQATFCCRRCHPGERLVKDCEGDILRTRCAPCGTETYQDKMNYAQNCRRCRRCMDHETLVSNCSAIKDRVCRCDTGYYRAFADSQTPECHKCTTCGPGERVLLNCTSEKDTECVPIENCTDACPTRCDPENGDTVVYMVISACFVVVLVATIIITNQLTKLYEKRKRKMLMRMESSLPSTEFSSQDGEKSTQKLIYDVESPDRALYQPVPRPVGPVCVCDPLSKLPDCVPREIKIDQLIYSVLEEVPVRCMKQLVRSLGVSEREIERAQEDHRTIKEAHYQMFLVWAEGGARAGGAREVLPRPLLQDLQEKLRILGLDGIAEKLEMTYGARSAALE